MHYDTQTLKEQIDLLALIQRDTTLKAHTNGKEHEGVCPFCGGRDRFHVQPSEHRWLCRGCTDGKWRDPITYIEKRHNVDFSTACQWIVDYLGGDPTAYCSDRPLPNSQKPITPAYEPSPAEWQAIMKTVIQQGQDALWEHDPNPALDYLRSRGLYDSTIERFQLGYSKGYDQDGVWIPKGILIPCIENTTVWYVKVRKLPEDIKDGDKYTGVKGNKTNAIFNAQSLLTGKTAIFCEGEFDAMIASQELQIPVITVGGSATNKPDLATWGLYFLHLESIFAVYDNDKAGQAGMSWISDLFKGKAKNLTLPDGIKDINDCLLQKKLYSWAVKSLLTASQRQIFSLHYKALTARGCDAKGAARLAWRDTIGQEPVYLMCQLERPEAIPERDPDAWWLPTPDTLCTHRHITLTL